MKRINKTYAQKIPQVKRKELLSIIEDAINFHERFRNAYFFTPPNRANFRRSYERYHQRDISFKYGSDTYKYIGNTECSCKNVYYYGRFYINEKRKDVRIFKKVQKELIEAIEKYENSHPQNSKDEEEKSNG